MGGGLRRLTPRYRRASLLGPQEGFKNGFQNEAKLGGSGAHFRLVFAVLVALEGVVERLGLVLGRLEPAWMPLGGLLGRLLVDLTASYERPGRSWGGPGRVLG